MNTQQTADQLDRLRERDEWTYKAADQRHTATVGEYTLSIRYRHQLHYWTVEHARYGELMKDAMADLISHARRDAVDFARAHVLGKLVNEAAR